MLHQQIQSFKAKLLTNNKGGLYTKGGDQTLSSLHYTILLQNKKQPTY